MKEIYLSAEMNVVDFDVEDIIATSIDNDGDMENIIPPSVGDNTTDELDPIP